MLLKRFSHFRHEADAIEGPLSSQAVARSLLSYATVGEGWWKREREVVRLWQPAKCV
jgi:hypothetical protein